MTDHAEVLQRLVEAGEDAVPGEWVLDHRKFIDGVRYEYVACNGAGDTQIWAPRSDNDYEYGNYDFIVAAANARASIKAALSELEALRAVVARLPKDKNGRPITIGCLIEWDDDGKKERDWVTQIHEHDRHKGIFDIVFYTGGEWNSHKLSNEVEVIGNISLVEADKKWREQNEGGSNVE